MTIYAAANIAQTAMIECCTKLTPKGTMEAGMPACSYLSSSCDKRVQQTTFLKSALMCCTEPAVWVLTQVCIRLQAIEERALTQLPHLTGYTAVWLLTQLCICAGMHACRLVRGVPSTSCNIFEAAEVLVCAYVHTLLRSSRSASSLVTQDLRLCAGNVYSAC